MLDPRQIYATYEIILRVLTATDFTPDADTSRRNIPGMPEPGLVQSPQIARAVGVNASAINGEGR